MKRSMQEPTFLILTALAAGPQHGYAIIADAGRISGGVTRLQTGTLYMALDRLSSAGLVECSCGRPPGALSSWPAWPLARWPSRPARGGAWPSRGDGEPPRDRVPFRRLRVHFGHSPADPFRPVVRSCLHPPGRPGDRGRDSRHARTRPRGRVGRGTDNGRTPARSRQHLHLPVRRRPDGDRGVLARHRAGRRAPMARGDRLLEGAGQARIARRLRRAP